VSRPILEIRQRGGGDRALAWLARELSPWWEVRATRHASHRPPTARFVVFGPHHEPPDDLPDDGASLAIAVRAAELHRLDPATVAGAATVLTDRLPEQAIGPPVHLAPPLRFDPRRWRPAAPFVRARLRQRLGGDADVLDCRRPVSVDPGELRLAAVAIVDIESALPALALATPCVIDPAAAETLGIEDGVHATVVGSADAAAAALDLLGDIERAARFSRCARSLVEERHDDVSTAMQVSRDLGLDPWASRGPDVAVLALRLWELGAPCPPLADGAWP
jgi:hypothetical protein